MEWQTIQSIGSKHVLVWTFLANSVIKANEPSTIIIQTTNLLAS